jgi:hypothetical protein
MEINCTIQETSIELVYNTIKIPYGKRFELEHLMELLYICAGTTLKYPVKFIASQNRQVFFEGEAFFDVAKIKNTLFLLMQII